MGRGRTLIVVSVAVLLSLGGDAVARSGSSPRTVSGWTAYAPLNRPGEAPRHARRSACAAHDRRPLVSRRAGAATRLVPGAPDQLLLCRYTGFGPYPHPVGPLGFRLLAHHVITSRARIADLAAQLDALRPVTGAQACPADDGAAIIALFGYRSAAARADPVTVDLEGCSTVTNGHVVREAGAALMHTLVTLAGRGTRGSAAHRGRG